MLRLDRLRDRLLDRLLDRPQPVRAAIAMRAISFTALGAWSMGTTAALLADSAGNDGGAAGQTVFAKGGPGALSDALAAAARGVVKRGDFPYCYP